MKAVASIDWDRLTAQELQTVALLGQGHQDWQIALKLCCSGQAVEARLQSVSEKLGVQDRLDLAHLAAHLGP